MGGIVLQWSDIWLLLAILLGGGQQQGASLQDIVSTGDGINHSIFTYEELASGLYRLNKVGLINENDKKRFVVTSGAVQLYEDAKARGGGIHEVWGRLSQALQAESPPGSLPNPKDQYEYPGLTRADVALAIEAWQKEAAEIIRDLRNK